MTRSSISKCVLVTAMLCFFSASSGGDEDTSPDVKVELSSQKPLWLHVTVRSRAETRVTFYKYLLPWGNRNSMLFVPVNRYGQCVVEKVLPIDDPSPEKVSIKPIAAI